LIYMLGGEPNFPMKTMGTPVALIDTLSQIPEKGRSVQSIYQQAISIAEYNKEKSGGFFSSLFQGKYRDNHDSISRSDVIRLLTHLRGRVWSHMRMADNLVFALQ